MMWLGDAKRSFNSCIKLCRGERLRDVITSTSRQTLYPVRFLSSGRKYQNGDVTRLLFSYALYELHPLSECKHFNYDQIARHFLWQFHRIKRENFIASVS